MRERWTVLGKKKRGKKKRLQLYKGPQRKWDWREEAAVAGLEDR